MTESQKIAPCLWFDGKAEEAAEFYVSTFRDSYIEHKLGSPSDWPAGKAGDIILVTFVLAGQHYQALNGGPNENGKFNESVSLSVTCEDQAEVDRYWDLLTSDGGEPSACGWCKDRFGVSWQVIPKQLEELCGDYTTEANQRAMNAMLQMGKIDIATLERAHRGEV